MVSYFKYYPNCLKYIEISQQLIAKYNCRENLVVKFDFYWKDLRNKRKREKKCAKYHFVSHQKYYAIGAMNIYSFSYYYHFYGPSNNKYYASWYHCVPNTKRNYQITCVLVSKYCSCYSYQNIQNCLHPTSNFV